MEKEKAIEIFNKWMDCKDAYQADPSCDGNCFSCEYYASAEEEKEAMLLAISALEKQIPKKPKRIDKNVTFDGNWKKVCPACGRVFGGANHHAGGKLSQALQSHTTLHMRTGD